MEFPTLRQKLLAETKRKVKEAVTPDILLIQAITALEQLEQATHGLAKKGREWYAFLAPEAEWEASDHEAFLKLVASKSEGELATGSAMAGDVTEQQLGAATTFLTTVSKLYEERERLLLHIGEEADRLMPNMTLLGGATIAAKLLAHAGSLHRLAFIPSSTLQLYGAETALFRHLKDKRKHKSPKYGLIFNHPLIQHVKKQEQGKAARSLADKLSLCAKIDLFKGELKAPEYKEALEKRFGRWDR